MVKDINGSTQHSFDLECSIVYQYLHHRAATQSPVEVIQEFQNLFQLGKNQNIQVTQALGEVILSEQFNEFMSNCFYTIINCWSDTLESRFHVDKLLDTLDIITSQKSLDRRKKSC